MFGNIGMAYPRGKPREPTNKGVPHSEETRRKISESCKKIGMGKWNIGKIRTAEHRKHMFPYFHMLVT